MFRKLIISTLLFAALPIARAERLPLVPTPGEPSLQEQQAQAAALRRKARVETIAGAVLLPVGFALAGAGAALIITNIKLCIYECRAAPPDQRRDRTTQNGGFAAGVALSAVGYAGVLSGVPLLIAGAVHKHRARQLDPRLSIAPTFDSRGTLGASANLSFVF
jgi:hypothetical protein